MQKRGAQALTPSQTCNHRFPMKPKDKLVSLLTQYDAKQSTKKGHNPFALGIYFQAADDCMAMVESGKPLRNALMTCFNDRLLDYLLRGMGLPIATTSEHQNAPLTR